MQVPTWFAPGFWGAAIGAIAVGTVGFTQLGWITAATAERVAQERSEMAIVTALVPFCITKAQHDPDQVTLVKLQAEHSSYTRNDLVNKAGWATLEGKTSPDDRVARACSDKLYGMKAG
jgi:hypothetical protein